jgi:hypothetical protein
LCCQDCVRPKILQDSRVKITISIDSCESRYEISVCETREKLASLLILTRESRENLWSKKRVSLFARISKSNSRVNSSCRVIFWGHCDDFFSKRYATKSFDYVITGKNVI